MIYKARNRSNDATESQMEKRPALMLIFEYSQSKITGLNKMCSLKSLAMSKCESRTSLYAVQYN